MPEPTFEMMINYPPNFRSRYGYGSPQAKHILNLFEGKQEQQLQFLSIAQGYEDRLSQICIDAEEGSQEPRWNQPWFPPLDGISMYAMVASTNPNVYLEIGSGNSTKFAARAIRDHALDTTVISVDPQPRAEVDEICDWVIRKPAEEATDLEDIIEKLRPDDIVFFDGSHRCLQNSDVTAFFIDYLPSIPEGVKIGIHDIFWPNDYPEGWIERYYNEQYVLGAFVLGQGSRFPLIFSCAYMGLNFGEETRKCLDKDLLIKLKKLGKGIGGGTLWFSKVNI